MQLQTDLMSRSQFVFATTANLAGSYNNGNGTITASSNGAISIDGVSLSVNDRVLVKDQTSQVENGFYKVTTVGSGSAFLFLQEHQTVTKQTN